MTRFQRLKGKIALAVRIWGSFLIIQYGLHRHTLPVLVSHYRATPHRRGVSESPERLGRAVHRALSIGRFQTRCLPKALVLLRLLAAQDNQARLVIGLPPTPRSADAHAWIEIDGVDVGPSPGRGNLEALVSYPLGN